MKKLVLLLSAIFIASAVFSQTILTQWEFGPTSFSPSISFSGDPSDFEVVSYITVQNTGSESATIKVAREELSLMPGTINQFCWGGLCFPPGPDTSGLDMTLAPGELTTEFSGHLQPNGTEGVSIIKYTFYEVDNPSNFSSVIVHYNTMFGVSSEAGAAVSDHIRLLNGSAVEEITGGISIHNTSSEPLSLIAVRGIQLVPGGSENFFEFDGISYPITADTSGIVTIGATSTDDSFVSHYNANGSEELGQIAYAFINPMDPTAYAVMMFNFETSLGLSEKILDDTYISNAYPNPAVNTVAFDYDIPAEVNNAEIVLTNLVGSVVARNPLEGNSGTIKLDVSNIREGIYFATLKLDNYTAFTQKVLVQ